MLTLAGINLDSTLNSSGSHTWHGRAHTRKVSLSTYEGGECRLLEAILSIIVALILSGLLTSSCAFK